MTNWEDAIYVGEKTGPMTRVKYLNFCLICGEDRRVKGKRYKVQGSRTPALLIENPRQLDCGRCGFPTFSSSSFEPWE